MGLISGSIPNLVNGVSQQPPSIRLASQCDLQENALSAVASGVSKRPPAHHRARISNVPLDGAFVHTVNRDASEQYEVVVTNGDLQVFRLDGSPVPVNFPNGKAYLGSSDPSTDFRAVSVVDYTFLLNRSKRAAASPAVVPPRPFEALVWVKQGAYAANYGLIINGYASNYTTADASTPSNAGTVRTEYIAQQLWEGIQPILQANNIQGQNLGSVLYFSCAVDFTIGVADSVSDNALRLVKGAVQNFADLPTRCVGGFVVQVRGANETAYDDYFVRYESRGDNPFGGIWVECAKPGEQFQLDASTLPHALVREADGAFTLRSPTWADRTVGARSTLDFPSFVGAPLEDIFFHRNRLGILAGENVVLSRAGEFFNFFRKSALQLLDTDPIDVAVATGGGAAPLRHAVAFNEGLLLFSDQVQFQFGKADLLTPKTASITLTTQFGCNIKAKPVGAGRNVYFTTTRGEFSAVREYYLDVDSRANDAADITAHVPRYVPKNITKLAASPNEDVLVMASANDPGSVYVYRFYWQGGAKLQSSWSRWTLGTDARVLSLAFIESSLWLCVARADGTFLEEIRLEPGRTDAGQPFEFLLDRRVGLGSGTEFRIPYRLAEGDTYQLVATVNGVRKIGQLIPFTVVQTDATGTTIRAAGAVEQALFGRSYAMRYRFSTIYVREEAPGGGQQPVVEGRLQLRKLTLSHSLTGAYRVEVRPTARGVFTYQFSGRVLGEAGTTVGGLGLNTGTFSFPLAARNEEVSVEIVNDTPLPSTFLGASWEGFYTSRSRRV